MTKEPADDQIYFRILDKDKNSIEQLTHDSEGIPDSSQVSAVPIINTSISHVSTKFVMESLFRIISKENNFILLLNTATLQLSDNQTIQSILTNCNTPQLPNIVDKLSTNQTTEKMEPQHTPREIYLKCATCHIDQKIKSLHF